MLFPSQDIHFTFRSGSRSSSASPARRSRSPSGGSVKSRSRSRSSDGSPRTKPRKTAVLSTDDESDADADADESKVDSSKMLVANPLFALLNKPVIHASQTDKSDNEDDEGEGKTKGEAKKPEDDNKKADPKEYFERGLLEYNNGEITALSNGVNR